MIKKREVVVLSLLLCIFLVAFVSAADNETTNETTSVTASTGSFEKGYSCLKEQINTKATSSLTTEELAMGLLALGYDPSQQAKLKGALDSLGSDGQCWPKSGCTIKETAMVLLAYSHIYQNTDKIENWLMNKTSPAIDLVWYLQIDSNNKSKCTITYDGSAKNINIDENKVLTGTPGSCFRFSPNGYWLEIDTKCYGKNFDIVCDADFLTSTFYKRKTDQTYYITTTTHTASPNGKTSEKVNSVCFYQGGCNYEGSLWATYALSKKGKDIKPMLPYLISLAKDNQRYLPSSFLFSLTGFDEYFADLTGKQDKKGYWQISETNRRYYDTGIALLALYGRASEQADRAIQYLLEPTVQLASGCWNGNNIRDTALILYSASPKSSSTESKQCRDVSAYSCLASTACSDINGTVQTDYSCFGGSICCDKKIVEKTCSEKSGKICLSSQECDSGGFVTASGTSYCCLGNCVEPAVTADTCTLEGADYRCALQCNADEDERSSLTCPESGVCCVIKSVEESSFPWGTVILLIILIALVVLGIIYRDQLKIWWFKIQSKFKKGPVSSQQRPGMPPAGSARPGMSMPMRPGMPMPPRPGMFGRPMSPPAKTFQKQSELDETLRKLKDMSK